MSKLETPLDPRRPVPRTVILDLTFMANLDSTGLEALKTLHGMLARRGSALLLAGMQQQPEKIIEASGFAAALGEGRIFPSLAAALKGFRRPSGSPGAQQTVHFG